jgi:hypothetical protein
MAKVTFNLKDTDNKALDALANQLKKSKSYVKVGLPDSDHEGSHLTIAQIGIKHEYGDPDDNIPERPFLAVSLKKAKARLVAVNRKSLKSLLNNKITFATALELMGVVGQGIVQAYISEASNFKPLSERTIAARRARRKNPKSSNTKFAGVNNPLIDTGQMRASLTYEVVEKN